MIFAEFGMGVTRHLAGLCLLGLGRCSSFGEPALAQTNNAVSTNHSIEFPIHLRDNFAQTNQSLSMAQRVAEVRWDCIQNRRIICGKILKGAAGWAGRAQRIHQPDAAPVEFFMACARRGDGRSAPQILSRTISRMPFASAWLFLTDLPKKPVARAYDYVNLTGFPTGQYTYTSVGDVQRTVRRFSAKLDKAVQWNLDERRTAKRAVEMIERRRSDGSSPGGGGEPMRPGRPIVATPGRSVRPSAMRRTLPCR